MQTYGLDGIWHNSIAVSGICYCSRCQASYQAAVGKPIPILPSASEAEQDVYMRWKTEVADQYMTRMRQAVKLFGEDRIYSAEVWAFSKRVAVFIRVLIYTMPAIISISW